MSEKIVVFNRGKRTYRVGKSKGLKPGEYIEILPGKSTEIDEDYAVKLLRSYPDLVDARKEIPQFGNSISEIKKLKDQLETYQSKDTKKKGK